MGERVSQRQLNEARALRMAATRERRFGHIGQAALFMVGFGLCVAAQAWYPQAFKGSQGLLIVLALTFFTLAYVGLRIWLERER